MAESASNRNESDAGNWRAGIKIEIGGDRGTHSEKKKKTKIHIRRAKKRGRLRNKQGIRFQLHFVKAYRYRIHRLESLIGSHSLPGLVPSTLYPHPPTFRMVGT